VEEERLLHQVEEERLLHQVEEEGLPRALRHHLSGLLAVEEKALLQEVVEAQGHLFHTLLQLQS
jgi:hypothetical protein